MAARAHRHYPLAVLLAPAARVMHGGKVGVVRTVGGSGSKINRLAVATLDSSVGKESASSLIAAPLSPSSSAATTSTLKIKSPPKPPMLLRSTFVIRGKVQGVFFRKYSQQKAVELSIFGFVENAEDGSVVGEAEGRLDKMVDFKQWLSSKGSPKSKIDSATFTDEAIESRKYSRFDIVR